MKKTEEEIIGVARSISEPIFTTKNGAADFETGFIEGAKWMQEQGNEWIEFKNVDKNKFNHYNENLILCKFDNGNVLRFNEEHDFALLTHVLFVPEQPKH